LGPVTPEPPPIWPDDRFDLVWTFTNTADGWTFAQVPQLIMRGDLPDPITEAACVAQAGSDGRER
jgi:hypothetical protein